MRLIPLALLALVFGSATATAQAPPPNCTPIQFPTGQTSATVRGIASNDGPTACYTLSTRAGQTASLSIVQQSAKDDTAFNIDGVVENQDKYTFKTQAKTYKIDVYLTFARQPPRPFTMRVSVR
jgi:hypothetical protein